MLNLQAMDYRLLLVMDTDGQPQSGSNCHGLPGSEAMLSMPGPDRRDPNKPGMGQLCSIPMARNTKPHGSGKGRNRHGLQGLPPLPPPPAGRLNFRWDDAPAF